MFQIFGKKTFFRKKKFSLSKFLLLCYAVFLFMHSCTYVLLRPAPFAQARASPFAPLFFCFAKKIGFATAKRRAWAQPRPYQSGRRRAQASPWPRQIEAQAQAFFCKAKKRCAGGIGKIQAQTILGDKNTFFFLKKGKK